MIGVGIVCGGWLAIRYASERGLDRDRVFDLVGVLALGGMLGSRILYLALNDAGALLRPGDWVGSRGFAFYGALILGPAVAGVFIWRRRLSLRYLDALAAGFPLGMAVGRIGDVISGEHYGPATTLPWGFRYLNPHSEVPGTQLAYHQGGFYEIVLSLAMLTVLWPLRDRFQRPLTLFWTTVAAYSAGRFVMFFWRSDTSGFGLGLNAAQATSVVILGVAAVGLVLARRHPDEQSEPAQA
jgi:phosphatidylglycerol---prolipoprotein diacylglyceryl transferase